MLTVTNLHVAFGPDQPVIQGVSFTLKAGEKVGVLGPSGSGKSLIAKTLVGLQPTGAAVRGSIRMTTRDAVEQEILPNKSAALRAIRGREIGMIWQDPVAALNPTHRIKYELEEAILALDPTASSVHQKRAATLLEAVSLAAETDRILHSYPHQLSGGQLQRIAIALALAGAPRLLIADEPTTSLDTKTAVEVLNTLEKVVAEQDCALLLITHDEAILRKRCDRIIRLEAGKIVADGPTALVLGTVAENRARNEAPPTFQKPVLRAENLSFVYQKAPLLPWSKPSSFPVFSDVNFQVHAGEWISLIGASGGGKTTLANCIAGSLRPTAGTIDLPGGPASVQIIPQKAGKSLNPRHTVGRILREVLRTRHRSDAARKAKTIELLGSVQLALELAERFPRELSGGQAQRVAIARALAADPDLLIADESVSALDAPVQEEILQVFRELLSSKRIGLLFITHNLGLVREHSDRIIEMSGGTLRKFAGDIS